MTKSTNWLRGLRSSGSTVALIVGLIGMLAAPAASVAAVPMTVNYDGYLRASSGGPAADGAYKLTFSLYASKAGKSAFWQEKTVPVQVQNGQFNYALGSTTALSAAVLAAQPQAWLGVTIGSDPELTRQPLRSVPFALQAAVAYGVMCSGCVPVSAMKFDDNLDLGTFGIKAKSVTATTLTAATVQAQSFIGDGSKLTGIKVPSGSCGAGKVVTGIAADGSLKCTTTAGSLPKDGLNQISNGVLKNQFVKTFALPTVDKGKAIPDATGLDLVSTITIPSIGTTEKFFNISVDLRNSDLSTLSIVLLPPDDKKVGVMLCDPCGKKGDKLLKTTFPTKTATKSGDLKKWIGKDPLGTWNLKITDSAFCVAQLDKINCKPKALTDGVLNTWDISTQILSNSRVQVNGDLIITGKLILPNAKPTDDYPMFPKGSRPFLYGMLEDHLNRAYQYGTRFAAVNNVPITNVGLHQAARQIIRGDEFGNIIKQIGGANYAGAYTDDTQQVLVAFIKNTTNADIKHRLYFYYSQSRASNNYAGMALNGKVVWSTSTNSTVTGQANAEVTFAKNSTSVLVLKMGTRYYTGVNSFYFTRSVVGFYNNSFKLPTGLVFDYGRYQSWVTNKP